MADSHAKILSKTPKGSKKGKSGLGEQEQQVVSNILTGVAEKPTFSSMARTPAGKHKQSQNALDKPASEDQEKAEVERHKLIMKVNMFLQNDTLGPILARNGINVREICPEDMPFQYVEARYKSIKKILGIQGVTKAVKEIVPKFNEALEKGICHFGYDVKGFAERISRIQAEGNANMEELSIEICGSYGGVGLGMRIAAEYLRALQEQKELNEAKDVYSKIEEELFQQEFKDKLKVHFAQDSTPPKERKQKEFEELINE